MEFKTEDEYSSQKAILGMGPYEPPFFQVSLTLFGGVVRSKREAAQEGRPCAYDPGKQERRK